MNKPVGYKWKSRLTNAKGGPPGGNNQPDDGLGIPTDTLASSAKSKSLRGRNRELRFICEREKRVLDWDWHRVKVGLEKEKMIFKKRALRMLEAPRHRYHTSKEDDQEEEEEPVVVVVPEKPPNAYLEKRRQTIAGTSATEKQRSGSAGSSKTPSFNSSDDHVMLEELQELNARLNVEKKACRSAPLIKNSVLTDPLYQLSSRLPKLEEEFSDMIKEHNALRRKKVEYKIKDFLVRVENFKLDQKEPKGLHLLHRDPISAVTFNNGDGQPSITQGERNLYVKTPSSAGGKRPKHKVPPRSANSLYAGSANKLRTNGTSGRRPGSSNAPDFEEEIFDPPQPQATQQCKATKAKLDVDKSVLLDTWEEFSQDMSLDALKKLVSFAAKNKSTVNPKAISQDNSRSSISSRIYRKILQSDNSDSDFR